MTHTDAYRSGTSCLITSKLIHHPLLMLTRSDQKQQSLLNDMHTVLAVNDTSGVLCAIQKFTLDTLSNIINQLTYKTSITTIFNI